MTHLELLEFQLTEWLWQKQLTSGYSVLLPQTVRRHLVQRRAVLEALKEA